MTEEIVKACVDCKHFSGPQDLYMAQMTRGPQEPECKHSKAASRDPIYGKAFCRQERQTRKGCGPQGKLWESPKTENKS